MDVDNPPRAIVVTSPKQGDGKSTVAANLAAAIALSGQHVTLVDADLRRPRVAALLGLDDTVGLTDVLTGRLAARRRAAAAPRPSTGLTRPHLRQPAAQPQRDPRLQGHARRDRRAEHRGHGHHRRAAAAARSPTPPSSPTAPTAPSSPSRAGRTLDTELTGALEPPHAVHARPLGVILNRVSKRTVGAGQLRPLRLRPRRLRRAPPGSAGQS